ncbi:hypothetical protein PUN28_000248 [Cardiocondyla obscurior]|uniref:Uncharacterized protein n=1 Tax=Cardiocondyla obscurior TaxID=286306 RepID=A0AAW2GYH6_9HYME
MCNHKYNLVNHILNYFLNRVNSIYLKILYRSKSDYIFL